MNIVNIHKLFNHPLLEVRDNLQCALDVEFDDKEVVHMKANEVILTLYILDAFKKIKILNFNTIKSTYAISNFYKDNKFHVNTINDCFSSILENIIEDKILPTLDRKALAEIHKNIFISINKIYNELIEHFKEHASSINILDILEIYEQDEIQKAKKDMRKDPTPRSIQNVYKNISDVVGSDKLAHNPLANMCRSGIARMGSVNQIIGARGYLKELTGVIIQHPLIHSYIEGFDPIEVAIVSREAAFAQYTSTTDIQDSEYLVRRMQLVAMYVEKLIDVDCGSKDYLTWTPKDEKDLVTLEGKFYVKDDKELLIKRTDVFLINQELKLRHVQGCKLQNLKHVCFKCFGALATGIPMHVNIGHFAVTAFGKDISQGVLSTKHNITTASATKVKQDAVSKKYFNAKEGIYKVKNEFTKKANETFLLINKNELRNIKNLTVDSIKNVNPARLSFITSLIFTNENNKQDTVVIGSRKRPAHFRLSFVKYIIEQDVKLVNNKYFKVSLKGWSHMKPVLFIPLVEISSLQLVEELKSMSENMKSTERSNEYKTPMELLYDLYNTLNKSITVNLAFIEILAYAFTVSDPENGDYRPGRFADSPSTAPDNVISANRSLSSGYAWERIVETILTPNAFSKKHKIDHPLDVVLAPTSVLNKHNR